MKIYFAGSAGEQNRESKWLKAGAVKRLISYYTHITNNKLNKDTQVIFDQLKKRLKLQI